MSTFTFAVGTFHVVKIMNAGFLLVIGCSTFTQVNNLNPSFSSDKVRSFSSVYV